LQQLLYKARSAYEYGTQRLVRSRWVGLNALVMVGATNTVTEAARRRANR